MEITDDDREGREEGVTVKRKKWTFVLSFTFNAVVFTGILLIAMIALEYFDIRPLHPTGQWQVKAYTHAGDRVSVRIYKELGHEVFFLRLASHRNVSLGTKKPRWFTVDFSERETDMVVSVDPRIYTVICQHFIIEQNYGLDVLDGKDGDYWFSYTREAVIFSNNFFFVSATQKNSGRPSVEVHRSTRGAWR